MTYRTHIDLPLLIPGLSAAEDECVSRLIRTLEATPGIDHVHLEGSVAAESEPPAEPALIQVEAGHDHHEHSDEHGADCDHDHAHGPHDGGEDPPTICLHYDSAVVSLAQVQRLAHSVGAEIGAKYGHDLFPIRAVIGEDAGRRIERDLQAVPGVVSAAANLPAQVIRIEWDRTTTDRERIQAEIVRLGIQAPARRVIGCDHDHDHEAHGHDHGSHKEGQKASSTGWYGRNKELAWSLIAGIVLVSAFLAENFAGLSRPAAIGLYIVSYGFGGWDLASHWVQSTRRGKVTFDIDLLMFLAAIGAAILGNWAEGAFLLFLFSLAHALEHYALGRARKAIEALAELTPDVARVRRGETESEVPIAEVQKGDVVIVLAGERIPVDGKVQSGSSAVNQAPITGESVPVAKEAGAIVFAGTVNGDGTLVIVNESAQGDRTLDRVIRLVEEAQTQKAPTERFVERFSAVFVPAVLVADGLMIVVPPMLGLLPWPVAFYRAMALLVAASPCALALGMPSAVLAGIAQAARHGVLVKGGAHLQNLGNVRAMAFDKTGTLTVGEPTVTDLVPSSGVAEDELLTITAAIESRSHHPLAAAVVRRAESAGVPISSGDVGELQNVSGRGVRSSHKGVPVEIGSPRLWEGESIPDEIAQAVSRLSGEGKSIMIVRAGGRWLGVLGISDEPRAGVRETLDELRRLGVKPIVMLTGDNRGVGAAIGDRVGVDEVRAELMPEDKVVAIRELMQQHGGVTMTGDGVNDAPALATASVGIAMGGAGTAVALETADVALMADDLSRLPFAVGLARASSRVIRQNLAISMGAIVLLVIATVSGLMRIGPAVALHEGSTLVVLANSLRLLAFQYRRSV